MQIKVLIVGFALLLASSTAWAIPPREESKKKSTATSPRTVYHAGVPSLSPKKQAMASQKSRAAKRAAAMRRLPATTLPTSAAYRKSTAAGYARGQSGSRSVGNSGNFQRPSRPGSFNRPTVTVDRPDIRFSRAINNVNVNNFNRQKNTTINNTTINNRTVVNRTVNNYNYQFNNNGGGRTHYPQLHYHWQPSTWSVGYQPAYYNYRYRTAGGGWLSIAGGAAQFVNPYYVRSSSTGFDYSQPIRVPEPGYGESRSDLVRSERAIRRFDDAREVFRRGEYGRASDLIDEAIELLPSDPTLHQFESLVLFARERYQEAAAVIYSVLAVSDGWDGDTMARFYESPRRYVQQVERLGRYVRDDPQANDARFLLAYHRVILGDLVDAQRQLEVVHREQPGDLVVKNFLAALRRQTFQ